MAEFVVMARWFLLGGGALAGLGLVLWLALPIRSTLPPFFITALLALGYGLFCWWRSRSQASRR